jgi:putative redox protein
MSTTFTAAIEHVNHTTSKATVRTHTVLIDRSAAKGGLDLGLIGGEYLLVSLGGCFTSHLMAAARAREAVLSGVKVAVTGTLDGTPERFTTFTMDVTGDCPDDALFRKLVEIAARACQVVSTLRLVAPIAITCAGVRLDFNEPAAVA